MIAVMSKSLFQTPEWEKFKLATGYQGSYRLDDILILIKRLPFGRSMLYSPMIDSYHVSPVTHQVDKGSKFINQILELAKKTRAVFYRAEFDGTINDPLIRDTYYVLQELGFRKAFEEMQPEHTLILDLTKPEEEILAQMKQKGRYNIKIAERSNITISQSATKGPELDHFYTLYEAMARRQKISYRSKQYFEALLAILNGKGYIKVYNACHESDVLATAIIGYYDDQAIYLFGGSNDNKRNLMAPYLLHWQIIKEAKACGFKKYDFFGIAPNDNPRHPWAGVTRFKKQFGGQEIHLLGSWDLVFRPVDYQAFKMAEKIRR